MKMSHAMKVLTLAFLVACLACMPLLSACSTNGSSKPEETVSEEPKYAVQLFIDCEQNLFFSKYDLDVMVDDAEVGNIEHGSEAAFEVDLTKGQHELVLVEEGRTSPDGRTSFVVDDEGDKFSYHIRCTKDQIEIEPVKEEAEATAEAQASGTQVVSHDGISIEVPATWKVTDADDGKNAYPDYGGMAYLSVIDVVVTQSSVSNAYSEYLEGILKGGQVTVTDEVKKTNVGDAVALGNKITFEYDNALYRGGLKLIFTESKTYGLMITIPDSVYDLRSSDIDAVFDSIKLDEPTAPASASAAKEDESKKRDAEESESTKDESKKGDAEEPESSKHAYVNRFREYDVWYLIDLDEMTATSFSTIDSPMVLPCEGDLDNGLTIYYIGYEPDFEEHLKRKTPGDDSVVIYTDPSGFESEWKGADVAEAEEVLASVS